MRHIISVLLENESGALSRVVGLFSQRGYNIETLTVAPTEDPTLSRMTIVTMGDERVLEQIQKQLHKLVDVLKVCDLSEGEHIEREIALVKARAAGGARDELKRLAGYLPRPDRRRHPRAVHGAAGGHQREAGCLYQDCRPDQRDHRSGALRRLRHLAGGQGAAALMAGGTADDVSAAAE